MEFAPSGKRVGFFFCKGVVVELFSGTVLFRELFSLASISLLLKCIVGFVTIRTNPHTRAIAFVERLFWADAFLKTTQTRALAARLRRFRRRTPFAFRPTYQPVYFFFVPSFELFFSVERSRSRLVLHAHFFDAVFINYPETLLVFFRSF